MKRKTTEQFVKEAKEAHNNKYTYEKTNYINKTTKVIITCPIHGDFEQSPYNHLHGDGCPKCAIDSRKLTKENFIERANKIHNNKYEYDDVEYTNTETKVKIWCPEHGYFEQSPGKHLSGQGCPECGGHTKWTIEKFITEAEKIHNGKYNYSKVNYITKNTEVTITCPIHGDFEQSPEVHLRGCGCPECSGKRAYTTETFIRQANIVHNNRYTYSNTVYNGIFNRIIITCPIHGDFEQTAHDHLCGCGCPECAKSKLELEIRDYLIQNNIEFLEQYTWDWLVYDKNQRVDFYLPKFNVVIECNGLQHFKSIPFFDKYESFEKRWDRDVNKRTLCKEHGIEIFYYSNIIRCFDKNFQYPYLVFEDINDLIKSIYKGFELSD